MSHNIDRRRNLLWQILQEYCQVSGILLVDEVDLTGKLDIMQTITIGDSSLIAQSFEFLGHLTSFEGLDRQGLLSCYIGMSADANTAEQTKPREGIVVLSVGIEGGATTNNSSAREGLIILSADITGGARVNTTIGRESAVVLSVGLNGGAVVVTTIRREGSLSCPIDVAALANIAENVVAEEHTIEFEDGAVEALGNTTTGTQMRGVVNTGNFGADNSTVIVESYTIEANETGGLTYIINASAYELDGKTLRIWG